jgi:SAM-dependent methyltransferase
MAHIEQVDSSVQALQDQLNAFWSTRREIAGPTPLNIRTERELQVWMEVLRPFVPPAPADVVDVGTGRGFLALVFAALGHRSRGFDLADGMLEKARENAAGVTNPPLYELGDAIAPPLEPNSIDALANRNVLWTLLDAQLAFRNWFTVLRPEGRLLIVHGVGTGMTPEQAGDEHKATYTDDIQRRLIGLYRQPTLEPALQFAHDAGFLDVQLHRLSAIEEFERQLEQDGGGPPAKTWVALTATRP